MERERKCKQWRGRVRGLALGAKDPRAPADHLHAQARPACPQPGRTQEGGSCGQEGDFKFSAAAWSRQLGPRSCLFFASLGHTHA